MKQKISTETKVYTILTVILMLLAIGFLLIGSALLPREARGLDGGCEVLRTDWYMLEKDGTRTQIEPPTSVKYPRGEWMTVECVLPKIKDSRQMLFFRSSQQDMYIYVDGMLRESYTTKNTRLFGRSSMSTNVVVEINKEDSGKTLSIMLMSPNEYSGTFNQVFIGTYTGFIRSLLIQYGLPLFTAGVILIIGIVTVILGVALQARYRFVFSLKYAAWTAIISSVQAIVESKLRQFYTTNMSVDGAVSYFLIGLLPIPVLLYVDAVQKERHRAHHRVMIIICLANMFLNIVLQLTGVQDLFDGMTRSYVLTGVSLITITASAIMDMRQGHFKETALPLFGVWFMFITGIVEVVAQLLHNLILTGFYQNVGALVLIIAAIMDSIGQIAKINREREQAILANSAKSDFLANMSHEIRTPINSIMGMNEMIIRESSEKEIKSYASDIKRASENLLDIVNDILDFSKVESGKMEIINEEYNLSNLIKDTDNAFRMRAESKNLEFTINVNPGCPSKLNGDESRIRQVIFNLLNNSVKYTDEGSIVFDVSYENPDDFSHGDVMMRFSVQDTGIGIKKEDQDKLFNNFERFDLKRNRNIEGSGLGLAITDRIVKIMHGRIEVNSVYGKGSTFTLLIPQNTVGMESVGDIGEQIKKVSSNIPEYKESFKAPDAKILVVDDVAMNANVIKGLLKKTEIKVFTALSGKDCLEMCKKDKFDLILMDHFMPNMDGIETLENIRKQKLADCPVIALTANAISGMKEMYLEKGFVDYLSKPVKPAELEAVIKKHLD